MELVIYKNGTILDKVEGDQLSLSLFMVSYDGEGDYWELKENRCHKVEVTEEDILKTFYSYKWRQR